MRRASRDLTDVAVAVAAMRPSARAGLTPEQFGQHQRDRILAAAVGIAGGHGVAMATVLRIARTARVAEKTIYEHYPSGRAAVLLAAYERIGDELVARTRRAATAASSFDAAMARATVSAFDMLAADPAVARFVLLEGPASGRPVAGLRARLVGQLADGLQEASLAFRGYAPPGQETARLVVGGITHSTAATVAAAPAHRLGLRSDVVLATLLDLYR